MLRCGFDYFQVPAPERRAPKLTSFPEVTQDYVYPRWSGSGATVLKSTSEPAPVKKAETVYYLPGHGGLISKGLGQALLDRGYDVTGRETVGEFKLLGFQAQVKTVTSDLREYFWRKDAREYLWMMEAIALHLGSQAFCH